MKQQSMFNGDSNVTSLDMYRSSRLEQSLNEPLVESGTSSPVSDRSQLVDSATHKAASAILERINRDIRIEPFKVAARFVTEAAANVSTTSEGGKLRYSVDKNSLEFDEISSTLKTRAPDKVPNLNESILERFYTVTLLAHEEIRQKNITPVYTAPKDRKVMAGWETEINIRDADRWREVMNMRAASSLGIMAVGRLRPGVRSQLPEYLTDVLDNRLAVISNYPRRLELTLGNKALQGYETSDRLIGLGNPLNHVELQAVLGSLAPPKLEKPTPEI